MILLLPSPYGFAAAWQNSRGFWQQTLTAVGHHLPLLLAAVVIPAALRAYFILKAEPVRAWELNLAEALLTVWRILICAIAVRIGLTPGEWQSFKQHLRDSDQLQLATQRLGAYLGRALHILLWELLLFAISLWLLHVFLSLIADILTRYSTPDRRVPHYKALGSILRNMIMVPLALVYLVALMRQPFS